MGQRQESIHVMSLLSPELESRRYVHIQETFFQYWSCEEDDNKERLRKGFNWKQRLVQKFRGFEGVVLVP